MANASSARMGRLSFQTLHERDHINWLDNICLNK